MCCSFRELWDDDHTTHYWCSTGKNLSWTRRARSFIGLGRSGSLSNMVSQVSHICSIVKGSSSAMSSWTCGWAAKGVHPSGGPWTWPTTAGCTPGGFGGLYEINNITNNIERKLVPLGAGGCLLPRSLPNPMGWWSCPSHCRKSVLRQPRLI